MYNKLIISLGSNQDCEAHISMADHLLSDAFHSIVFSESIYTEPLNLPGSAPFLNQLALAYTSSSADEVKLLLKRIETKLGQTPYSKSSGIIPIDIDLLQWNNEIIKEEDFKRQYISGLMSSLTAACK